MLTLILAAMAAGTAALVVAFPIAAVIEWRNTRPERGTLPIVGDRGRWAGRRRLSSGKLAAARAYEQVRAGLAWVWAATGDEAVRMADGRPLGYRDHDRPTRWEMGRPVWPRTSLTA